MLGNRVRLFGKLLRRRTVRVAALLVARHANSRVNARISSAIFWMIASCVFVFALYLTERGGYAFPTSELTPLARLTKNMFVLIFFLVAAFVGYALNDRSRRRAILKLKVKD